MVVPLYFAALIANNQAVMKNPIVKLMEDKLVEVAGLSLPDAEYVAAEVKRWLEDPAAKPSKSIHAGDKLIVTGSKDGTLVLQVTEGTRIPIGAVTKSDALVNVIPFPDIVVHES